MFASQIAEQNLWDEGFKAGIAEVLHELATESADADTTDAPTEEWVSDFSEKLSRRFN
jgi:hypothetical protein